MSVYCQTSSLFARLQCAGARVTLTALLAHFERFSHADRRRSAERLLRVARNRVMLGPREARGKITTPFVSRGRSRKRLVRSKVATNSGRVRFWVRRGCLLFDEAASIVYSSRGLVVL